MHPFVTPALDRTEQLGASPLPPVAPPLAPVPRLRAAGRFRVRRVEPASVAKATMLFHAVVVLVGLVAVSVLYLVAAGTGSLDDIERSLRVLIPGLHLRLVRLLSAGTVLGVVEVVAATTINVAAVRLYNLVADGGAAIEVELAEADVSC